MDFHAIELAYGAVRVLEGVTLSIAPGEVVSLLGPSGCGKTSLLRIAAGLEEPSGGSMSIDGKPVAGQGRFVPAEERGIGLVFQDYALFPHLTVLENVMFGLRALPAREAREVAQRALARVGMLEKTGRYPDALSGGEQQRVALARAVVPRPRVLLMDEPFSNLDKRMRDLVREETIALLRETGATAIIVTHDPEEAMRVADRIVLMRAGRVVQAGTAAEMYSRPADLAAARFFCELNEVPGRIVGGRAQTPVGDFPAEGHAEGSAVIVCIRPHGISLKPPGFCLPGRLAGARFVGEVSVADITVPGLETPLHARIRGPVSQLPGADVGFEIDRQEVLVFAASQA